VITLGCMWSLVMWRMPTAFILGYQKSGGRHTQHHLHKPWRATGSFGTYFAVATVAVDQLRVNACSEHAGCSNPAKNNVTSRVRLDEKYAARRALTISATQMPQFARVCGVFLQRDARLESSFPARTLSQATNSTARTLSLATNSTVRALAKQPNQQRAH
jgi:hypothetical protein